MIKDTQENTLSSNIIVYTTRGRWRNKDAIETIHRGAIAVVDSRSNLIANISDIAEPIHLRSTAKPFQLMPFIVNQLHQKSWQNDIQITQADIAVMMSSHGGDAQHVAAVKKLLQASGLQDDALMCGAHMPTDEETKKLLIRNNTAPSPLHNNCSGKHAAMLLFCKAEGYPIHNYLSLHHPLQQKIIATLRELAQVPMEDLGIGVDGCGLPTFILPLGKIALLYAELACPSSLSSVWQTPLETLFHAGAAHPMMLAGKNRFETALMQWGQGKFFAKTGADGILALGVLPTKAYAGGVGIALKISDGDTSHSLRAYIMLEILRQLQLFPTPTLPEDLKPFADGVIQNLRGEAVGKIHAAFHLEPLRELI